MNKKCPICGMMDDKFIAGVVNGEFISERCATCYGLYTVGNRGELASAATFKRERSQEDHQRDILPPWWKGKANPDFIRAYRKESKEYFTEKEIEESGA